MCANQTYWENKGCKYNDYRCTGDRPGQCVYDEEKCINGSSEMKPPSKKKEDGGCGENLMCTARAGKRAGDKVYLLIATFR